MKKYPTIETVDLSKRATSKEAAKKQIKSLQLELLRRQTEMRDELDCSVVVVFEGMDAAGKGGAIRRLTGRLDPRGLSVHAIGAPDQAEKAHNYLWRFQTRTPRLGHIAIFDRSWYGRVLVERVEGFCDKKEWKRAYDEINVFERTLVDSGTPVIKFWLHVGKQEQLRRFREREKDPFKKYKITEDDWRNRKKWDDYVKAANEMFRKTHTAHAPWNVVAGDDKWHARTQVLERVVARLRRRKVAR